MKNRFFSLSISLSGLLLSLITPLAHSAQQCEGLTGCDEKSCQIENQIAQAKKYDNQHKVSGLQRALEEVKSHCTNEGLTEKLTEELNEVNEEIAEYQDDLKEAIDDNEADKITKYQQKIDKKQRKAAELEKELSSLK